jgi:hypothetical protein
VRSIRLRYLLKSILLLFLAPATFGQVPRPPRGMEPPHPSEQEQKALREQAKRLNQERQEALVRDTDKLLKLATELKQYVDKSNENVLSMDVVRKADEIEKLAHRVKTKMKGD